MIHFSFARKKKKQKKKNISLYEPFSSESKDVSISSFHINIYMHKNTLSVFHVFPPKNISSSCRTH